MGTRNGIAVPALQSVLTGGFIGLAAGVAYGSRYGLLAGAIVAAFCWVHLLRKYWRIVEHEAGLLSTRVDSETEPEPQTTRIIMTDPTGQSGTIADLPVSTNQLVTLAAGLAEGRPLTERAWAGAYKPFTLTEFRELRESLIARGFARWRVPGYPKQGVELSRGGAALVAYYAESPSPPELV